MKNPVKKLEKEYEAKLRAARDAQRSGDIQGFAALTAEAEAIGKRLEDARRAG